MTETAPDNANPPPVMDQRNGLPAPVRILLKFIMYLGVAALLFWLAMSFVLNHYLRNSFEMYITGMLQQPTFIKGGVSLGTDLLKPSLVLKDIVIEKSPLFPSSMTYKVEKFEAGMPWQRIKEGQESTLSFFVHVENISADGKPYGSYDFPVTTLPNGDFEVKGIHGALGQAVLDGSLVKSGHDLSVKAKVTGVDYSQVVEGASGGAMTADIDLHTTIDNNADAILPFLSGTVFISGGAGSMAGNVVGFWTGNLVKSALEPGAATPVNCIVGDFKVDKGVATPRALVLDTADATIYGQGAIDLLRQYADMVFTPRPKQAGANLAVPLVIAGPFDRLSTSPDAAAVATRLAAMAMGLPSSLMQPLPAVADGGNACLAYVKGAGADAPPVTP